MALPSKLQRWLLLIGKFLFGQGIVQATHFTVGLLIIRLLSTDEYALYIISCALLAVSAVGSDMGLSHAMNTQGARLRDDPEKLSALLAGALHYRKLLFFATTLIVIVMAFFMTHEGKWPASSIALSLLLVLLTGFIQSQIPLKKSILNIHHQADALFQVGMAESLIRLGLIVFCFIWPTTLTALCVNLAGIIATRMVLAQKCRPFVIENIKPNPSLNKMIKRFIIPLIPSNLYYMVLGQLSVFLLSIYGYSNAIAETGALSRLGQIIGLLLMLNPFLIQPFFARINEKKALVHWTGIVLLGLFIFSLICMASVYWMPQGWLFVLGSHYSGLKNELPFAILNAILTLIGAVIYTIVISSNVTHGQFWYVIAGLTGQVAFIAAHGVQSTSDALILNTLPSAIYAIIQLILLRHVIKTWVKPIDASDQIP